jgi:hypothetical protein
MLTRDFTWSKNFSQELTEIVIGKEYKAYAISTDVHKLWKADLSSSFLSLRNLARDGASTSPLQTVASFLELPAYEPPGSDSAGLSPIRVCGAREKCGAMFAEIHTRCTVFPQREFALANENFLNFVGINQRILCLEVARIIFCCHAPC